MRKGWASQLLLVGGLLAITSVSASAQDKQAVDIFLEDEQLDVEADIPSVDLILKFKGLRYESIEPKKTFLPELKATVEHEPF